MLQPDSIALNYIVFVVAAATELYFFMMQRSALEIGRAAGINDRDSRRMLPIWYLAVWPTKLAKFAAAIMIGVNHSWTIAIVLLALDFVFSIFVPIPHRQFIPLFRRNLAKELGASLRQLNGEHSIYANLYRVLFDANHDPNLD